MEKLDSEFEVTAETVVTFKVFRRFFYSVMSRGKLLGPLVRLSPYIFLTGLFFCFLDMIIFKEDSIGGILLVVVLLMGALMLYLYLVPPKNIYNSMRDEYLRSFKYVFKRNGFSISRTLYDEECSIPYEDIDFVFESELSFYFGYRNTVYIVEKGGIIKGSAVGLSSFLKEKNPRKYRRIKE